MEPVRLGTGLEPLDEALVWARGDLFEEVNPRLNPLQRELLAGLDAVLPAEFSGQNNLPLGGDDSEHYVRVNLTPAVSTVPTEKSRRGAPQSAGSRFLEGAVPVPFGSSLLIGANRTTAGTHTHKGLEAWVAAHPIFVHLHPVAAPKHCEMWRKSRIAARILRRKQTSRPLSARDIRWANVLADDPSVTNRLIAQATSWLEATHATTAL